jgi:hypothetical protein
LLIDGGIGMDSRLVDAAANMDNLRKTRGCTDEEYTLALRCQDQPNLAELDRAGAQVMQHADGHPHLSYHVATTLDLHAGVMATTGAEPGNVSDQADFLFRVDEAVETPAERGLAVKAVVADKGHRSGKRLAGLEEQEVVALITSPATARGKLGSGEKTLPLTPIAIRSSVRQACCDGGRSRRERPGSIRRGGATADSALTLGAARRARPSGV